MYNLSTKNGNFKEQKLLLYVFWEDNLLPLQGLCAKGES